MTATLDSNTLVASSRPPSPTSKTATSTPSARNTLIAMAVRASNVDGAPIGSAAICSMEGQMRSTVTANASSASGSPSRRMRSRKVWRWGEV